MAPVLSLVIQKKSQMHSSGLPTPGTIHLSLILRSNLAMSSADVWSASNTADSQMGGILSLMVAGDDDDEERYRAHSAGVPRGERGVLLVE